MAEEYKFGQRVWVFAESEWWPAKISDPVVSGVPLEDGHVLAVFYGESSMCPVPIGDALTPFELTSEKASSTNPAIINAIAEARIDQDAIDTIEIPTTEVAKAVAAKVEAAPRARREQKPREKRQRSPQRKSHHAAAAVETTATASDSELLTAKAELADAFAASNLAGLRRAVMQLAGVRPSLKQLKGTGIGVTLGNMLHRPEVAPVAPLIRSTLRMWAGAIPQETRDAMTALAKSESVASLGARLSSTAAAASTSASTAGQTTVTPPPAPGAEAKVGGYVVRIRTALSSGGVAAEAIDKFLAEVNEKATTRDHRAKIIEYLESPDHVALRDQLCDGTMHLDVFLGMSTEQLKTDAQKKAEAEEELRLIKEKEEAEQDNVMASNQFECPKCGKFRATFYQMQTRGGDEPMTTFIKCLECKHEFTEGGYD